MTEIAKKPIKITETILRDAHQSLIATRMSTEQMLPIIEKLDNVGYHSLECWGGATFDASLRFLKEDPWERLRKLRDGFKNTKLQMLSVKELRRPSCRCCSVDRTFWDIVRMVMMWLSTLYRNPSQTVLISSVSLTV